ncbi:hypothetical protein E5288_WYG004793 [Bos mutus]|uniref:Uncharacterized protein n=1 Tax=Bos mutus TaxID=72004 RepID=A0A6B0QXH8_9CETA|nr:hypothetical protein [Bos mutus]
MELRAWVLLWRLVLLQSSAVLLSSGPSGPATSDRSVVSESTVSWAAGARAVLRCQSPRMVWTQDRLHDRQRVVHWDLSGSKAGGPARRLVDMYSTGEQRVGEQRLGEQRVGEQRVYEPRDRGRLLLPPSAFHDGNFSLFIRGTGRGTAAGGRGLRGAGGAAELTAGFPPPIPRYVAVEETDEGLYTCNLHHHYCHLYESLAVSLEVTDDPRAAGAHWDGEKEVLAVERGAPALLTCVNRAHVWTDRHLEEAQQVVHWDRQPPGVPHDRADRLLDLYASGERRAYGPPFLRDRVAVEADAFARGDFSLLIDPRRVFHLRVTEPAARPPPPPPPRDSPGNGSSHSGAPGPGARDPTLTRGRSVINVIVPEGRAHFFQQLGYVLATLLLFILLLITVVLATRQRRRGGYEYSNKKSKSKGKDINMAEFAVASGDQSLYRSEDIRLDYKNNILKERAEVAHSLPPAKNIDLDKGLFLTPTQLTWPPFQRLVPLSRNLARTGAE